MGKILKPYGTLVRANNELMHKISGLGSPALNRALVIIASKLPNRDQQFITKADGTESKILTGLTVWPSVLDLAASDLEKTCTRSRR